MGGYHTGIGGFLGGGYRQPNQAVHGGPDQRANSVAAKARAIQAQIAQQNAQFFAAARAVKNEGIKLGEIVGWRAWAVSQGWLYSMIVETAEWRPGQVMEAHKVGIPAGEGIHAFKTRRQAIEEYGGWRRFDVVIGEVLMWGDIVEFEKGWHAEFAKIHSLDFLVSDPHGRGAGLSRLQEIYKVGAAS